MKADDAGATGGNRPSWDLYFARIARVASTRSTCLRRHVGAVLVLEKRILATGYNGAPAGLAHCADTGCLREHYNVPAGERHELCRGLHAEMNALLQGARYGIRIVGATLYTTHTPCILCSKMIINCGIRRVVAGTSYPDDFSRQMLEQAGVELEVIPPPEGDREELP